MAVAAKLVEMKLLTTYQAEQIKAGRTKFNLGPYVITDFIGHGGMGQVFKGVHRMMGRECAVKVLPLHKATADAVKNFMREIRTQARLDHPNLVRAYDAGHDGKVHYLVTEFVPGMDLRQAGSLARPAHTAAGRERGAAGGSRAWLRRTSAG